MNKEEIHNVLCECYDAMRKIESIQQSVSTEEYEYYKIDEKARNASFLASVFKYLLFAFIFVVILLAAGSYHEDVYTYVYWGPVLGAIAYFVKQKNYSNKLDELNEKIKKIKNERYCKIQNIKKQYAQYLKNLPRDYWNTEAIDKMIEFLDHDRAHTFTEVFQLYDEYHHRKTVEQQNKEILFTQEQIMRRQDEIEREL